MIRVAGMRGWGRYRTAGAPAGSAGGVDWNRYWFDPDARADRLHCELALQLLQGRHPAGCQHAPRAGGALAATLGAELEGAEDTIWIHPAPQYDGRVALDEGNKWWRLHLDLVRACRRRSEAADGSVHYFTGCPDLIEGLDTLASLRGTQAIMLDMTDRPQGLAEDLQAVNDAWFEAFDRIYDAINVDGEMAFCYFSIWGPGKVAKLQSDISGMISPRNFRRFVQPYVRQQCERLDYSLYHLDGVDAVRHLPALLEIELLNAIQWTPGVGQPQGGDPCWFDLYRRVRAAGKSVMACWVELDELAPLLDAIGPAGLSVLMHFHKEQDIDDAVKIAERYR